MTSEKAQVATATSTNTVEFGFPYGGPQHAFLQIRKHPRYGTDVILSLDKAHFLCRMDGCKVLVRFDDGEATEYEAIEPADHSIDMLFLRDHDTFVSNAIKAKRVKIEAQFYQNGPRVFTFNVSNLPSIFSEEIVKAQREEELQRKERERARQEWEAELTRRTTEDEAAVAQQTMVRDLKASIQAKIEGRVVAPANMQGNPEVLFDVVLLTGGEVFSATLTKSSGVPAYDAAVERAIMAAQPLPVPSDAGLFEKNFRELSLVFRPKGDESQVVTRSVFIPPAAAPAPPTLLKTEPNQSAAMEERLKQEYGQSIVKGIKHYQKYPPLAQRRGWEGTVEVLLQFAAGGKVMSITLGKSSGRSVLDEEALNTVRRALPLPQVPQDLRGREFTVTVPIVFKLQES